MRAISEQMVILKIPVKTSFIVTAILTSICLGGLAMSTAMGSEDVGQRREKAHKAFKEGNFRDAYDALRGCCSIKRSFRPATI